MEMNSEMSNSDFISRIVDCKSSLKQKFDDFNSPVWFTNYYMAGKSEVKSNRLSVTEGNKLKENVFLDAICTYFSSLSYIIFLSSVVIKVRQNSNSLLPFSLSVMNMIMTSGVNNFRPTLQDS